MNDCVREIRPQLLKMIANKSIMLHKKPKTAKLHNVQSMEAMTYSSTDYICNNSKYLSKVPSSHIMATRFILRS